MRNLPVVFVVILFICFKCIVCVAQTPQEVLKQMRSTVTEKIDGREYYIHLVKRGQTLYMISKAYGVEVNTLIRENPEVKEGLKADQKLRIPVAGQKQEEQVKPVAADPANKEEQHVAPAPNPETPVRKKSQEPSLHPKATKQGSLPAKVPVAPPKQVVPDQVVAKTDSAVVAELPCGEDKSTKKDVYKVALMLPLFLTEIAGIDAEHPDAETLEAKSFEFLPFYEGFRLALDSIEKSGLKIKLYVYDADKDTARTRQILRKPEMKTMDLIFGVLYHRNFQIVAEFARKNKIILVNPISEKSELVNANPWVFKVLPSKTTQFEELADYMNRSFKKGQLLIVRSGQYNDRDAPERLKKACQEHGMNAKIVEGQEGAIAGLSKEKDNYLVVFTDNTPYAFDLTRRLFELRNDYNMILVGLPDWSSLEGLETEYLAALKTHIVTQSFIDYDDAAVKVFVRKYQSVYHADPALLCFQGFDVAWYFLSALNNYGTGFPRCIDNLKIKSMQTHFDFRQGKGNGFENRHWMIYKYDNFRMVPVN
ncbi:MAG: ABC transporter substrate-binding protein [Bacteroidota bacterium]